MTIKFQDENKMEIDDMTHKGEPVVFNIIMGVSIIGIILNVLKSPSQYLFALVPLTIFGGFWFSFRRSRGLNKTITIDKKSNTLTIDTTYISGRKKIKEYSLNTIRSITTPKKQLFGGMGGIGRIGGFGGFILGNYRMQLPTMYFEFQQENNEKIKIWTEKRHVNNPYGNYLSDEEKRIPEKISKFLNIPIVS